MDDMKSCDARLHASEGIGIIDCDQMHSTVVDSTQHSGVVKDYAYPGSRTTITWYEHDRRNFRGGFARCGEPTPTGLTMGACILPVGHRGNHAS